VSVLLAVLWKDLLSEWRSRDRVVAMGIFSMLVAVVFHFSLPGGAGANTQAQLPGLLWVAYIFAAVLGLNRAFSVELENDALSALAMVPVDRGWVFLGKALANAVILGFVQVTTAAVFALFFQLDLWPHALPLAGVVALGSLGITTAGTLFAAVSVRTRFREVMLPLLLLPLLVPVLAACVRATSELLRSGTLPWDALQLLIVADAIYAIVSFIGFEYVLDE
jgi:heme exporter protein B